MKTTCDPLGPLCLNCSFVRVLSRVQVAPFPGFKKKCFLYPLLFPRWPMCKVTLFQIINRNVLKCLFFTDIIPSTLEESFLLITNFPGLEEF